MKRPLVKCCCCKGYGKAPLSSSLFETLVLIDSNWWSTAELYAKLPSAAFVGITALNNRLVELQRLKLVEHELRGKAKYWRRQ